jgi:toxin ParE1/3/4
MIWSLRQTRQSEQDFLNIWSYIAVENVAAASQLLLRLDKAFRALETAPLLGVSLDDLRKDHRYIVIEGYILIYCLYEHGKVCELVRVLNGARNWRKALSGPMGDW